MLTEPDWSCTEKTLGYNHSKQGISFGRETPVRQTTHFNEIILMLSRFGSQLQQQIHMCAALILGFQLPRPALAHIQISILILSFLQPF